MILIKYFFLNPYTFHIFIILGVYGSKNRHLNHKEKMGGEEKKIEKLRMVALHPERVRQRDRETEREREKEKIGDW